MIGNIKRALELLVSLISGLPLLAINLTIFNLLIINFQLFYEKSEGDWCYRKPLSDRLDELNYVLTEKEVC